MTLKVAIASEYDLYDGEIYRFLLQEILGVSVEKWPNSYAFSGCRTVAKLAPAFLAAAASSGIEHALLAVDNDGGARRRPEHEPGHVPPSFRLDDDEACRECWLVEAVPKSWMASGAKVCVGVPIQTLETWLLTLRGDVLHPTAEQHYGRAALKKRFFGKPTPPLAGRIRLALEVLRKPNALATLRTRPSFARFEAAARAWA